MFVFASQSGSTRIVVTLYGDVTPEREAAERKAADHRAVQLGK